MTQKLWLKNNDTIVCVSRPGLDITNVLQAVFVQADHKSTKRHWWLDCLFLLLCSDRVTAARKQFGEIDPRFIRYDRNCLQLPKFVCVVNVIFFVINIVLYDRVLRTKISITYIKATICNTIYSSFF